MLDKPKVTIKLWVWLRNGRGRQLRFNRLRTGTWSVEILGAATGHVNLAESAVTDLKQVADAFGLDLDLSATSRAEYVRCFTGQLLKNKSMGAAA